MEMGSCEGGGGKNKNTPYSGDYDNFILVYNTCKLLEIAAVSSSKKLTNLKGNIEE
jgi:hypothetical protein